MTGKFNIAIRIILGVGLILFGLDKFYTFIPHNHVMDEDLVAAYTGLMANKFILPTVGLIELFAGLLLLTKRYSFFGLTLMIPVTFGIISFHLAVDVEGIIPGLVVALMHLYLLYQRKISVLKFINE